MSLRFYLAAVIRAFQVNRHAFLFHRKDLITTDFNNRGAACPTPNFYTGNHPYYTATAHPH